MQKIQQKNLIGAESQKHQKPSPESPQQVPQNPPVETVKGGCEEGISSFINEVNCQEGEMRAGFLKRNNFYKFEVFRKNNSKNQ